ncbi:MAG: hypothetical protein WC629_00920, partial [Candidatus Paceibacterota bacterium]
MSQFHQNPSHHGKVLPPNKKKKPEKRQKHVHERKSLSDAIARREAVAVRIIIEELQTSGYDASEGDLISMVRCRVNLHQDRISSVINKLVSSKFLVNIVGT